MSPTPNAAGSTAAIAPSTSPASTASSPGKCLNLLQRLNKVQQAADYIQKEKKAGMRYSVVSHDAVTAKVRPLLVEHGVLYYPLSLARTMVGNRTELDMMIRFVNIDDPADFIDVATAGFGIDDQDKGAGKAISYAVKYALLKTLGLETGDDPDTDQDVKHQPAPRSATTAVAGMPGVKVVPPASSDWDTVVNDIIAEIAKAKTGADMDALGDSNKRRMQNMPAEFKQRVYAVAKRHREQIALPAMASG